MTPDTRVEVIRGHHEAGSDGKDYWCFKGLRGTVDGSDGSCGCCDCCVWVIPDRELPGRWGQWSRRRIQIARKELRVLTLLELIAEAACGPDEN